MADEILNRINKFYGGITTNERDTTEGVHLNMEEVDIFSNKSSVTPNTIFRGDFLISSITRSGTTATVTTSTAHGLTTNDVVTIFGSDQSEYNGTKTVTVVNDTVFTFTVSGSPTSPATGTMYMSVMPYETIGYTLDENDNLFALSNDGAGTPKIKIWKKTNASADTPGAWAVFKTSSYNFNWQSPIARHQHQIAIDSITRVTTTATATTTNNHLLTNNDVVVIVGSSTKEFNGTFTITVTGAKTFTYTVPNSGADDTTSTMYARVSYLYYVDDTNTLTKLGTLSSATNESQVDQTNTTMTLPGLGKATDRIAMIEAYGGLYILNGQYISEIDIDGQFIEKRFTLPNGWDAISADIFGNFLGILTRSINSKLNYSKVIYWDLSSYEQPVDVKNIPMGGPQIIVNYQEIPFVFCAQNGKLFIYRLTDGGTILVNNLSNVETETDDQPVIPDACKFVANDRVYFGLWKTDKTGLYEFGRFDANSPFALVLGRRFNVSDYSVHIPYAVFGAGPNIYGAFVDDTVATSIKLEGNNSPRYSSNAVIETVFVDGGKPEFLKEWTGFLIVSKPLAANCSIGISAKVDNATSYDTNSVNSLTSSNDQLHDGGTGDTYWKRDWTSLVGRTLQAKVTMESNGSIARPILISLGLLSRTTSIYG